MASYSYTANLRKKKIGKVVHRVRRFQWKHQNTVIIVLSFILTYYLIKTNLLSGVVEVLGQFGYLSAFVLGFLFSLGFTTTPAAASLFYLADHINPFGMAFVAAIGAAISNYVTYLFVKHELLDEIRYIFSEELKVEFAKFEITLRREILRQKWLRLSVPAFAGILTAMPVPTEIVAAMLWNIVRYHPYIVIVYSFIFSFIGILLLGLFGFHA